MKESLVRARLSDALKEDMENLGSWSGSFFCRWFSQRRESAGKSDAWGKLAALYSPQMSEAQRRQYLEAAQTLLKTEKRLPVNKTKAEPLLTRLSAEGPTQPLLDELHRRILDAFALRDARIYYYDTFDPGRKKSRDLELLDAFCKEKELQLRSAGTSGNGRLSPEELSDWDRLTALFRAERKDTVLLPICTDACSGAALYLVGRRYLPWARTGKGRSQAAKSCYYQFLLPMGPAMDRKDGPCSLLLEEDQDLQMPDYSSAREAESWFWGYGAVKAVEQLRDWNDEAPAGCPKRFLDRLYAGWEEPEEADEEELSDLGRAVFAADVQADAARRRMMP